MTAPVVRLSAVAQYVAHLLPAVPQQLLAYPGSRQLRAAVNAAAESTTPTLRLSRRELADALRELRTIPTREVRRG